MVNKNFQAVTSTVLEQFTSSLQNPVTLIIALAILGNGIDTGQTTRQEQSDQGLHCFLLYQQFLP